MGEIYYLNKKRPMGGGIRVHSRWALTSMAAFSALALTIVGGPCAGGQLPVLPAVGPAEPEHVGYLVVYSATEPSDDGEVMYYTHTDYELYSARGVFMKKIRNSIEKGDEVPERVALAPGRYMIHAQSEMQGYVAVPIIVADGRTTVVNLEADRRGSHRTATR